MEQHPAATTLVDRARAKRHARGVARHRDDVRVGRDDVPHVALRGALQSSTRSADIPVRLRALTFGELVRPWTESFGGDGRASGGRGSCSIGCRLGIDGVIRAWRGGLAGPTSADSPPAYVNSSTRARTGRLQASSVARPHPTNGGSMTSWRPASEDDPRRGGSRRRARREHRSNRAEARDRATEQGHERRTRPRPGVARRGRRSAARRSR